MTSAYKCLDLTRQLNASYKSNSECDWLSQKAGISHLMCGETGRGTENERIRGAGELSADGGRAHLLLVEEGGISRAQAYKTISRWGARG